MFLACFCCVANFCPLFSLWPQPWERSANTASDGRLGRLGRFLRLRGSSIFPLSLGLLGQFWRSAVLAFSGLPMATLVCPAPPALCCRLQSSHNCSWKIFSTFSNNIPSASSEIWRCSLAQYSMSIISFLSFSILLPSFPYTPVIFY